MMQFLREAGPVIFPLMLLAIVILALTLWNSLVLLIRGSGAPGRRRNSIDAVLFWGAVAAVLGFLGQWIGITKMSKHIFMAGVVNPGAVVMGLSESLLTTITGMAIFTISAFLWFFLRVGLWSAERSA